MRDLFSRLLIHGGSVALVLVTGIISWQVFGRFVLNSSPSWTEQAALLLMIWYVMLGAAAGVKEGFHIRIALFEQKLGGQGRNTAARDRSDRHSAGPGNHGLWRDAVLVVPGEFHPFPGYQPCLCLPAIAT